MEVWGVILRGVEAMRGCEEINGGVLTDVVREILLAQPLNPFVRLELRALPMLGSMVDQDKQRESAKQE